ncbi:MAG: asparagine synthase-related protein [Microthrixaceae bacterium]
MPDPDDRYLRGMTHWPLNEFVAMDAPVSQHRFMHRDQWPKFAEKQQRWMWLDTLNYLPDDILVKVDRTSMAVSLESAGATAGSRRDRCGVASSVGDADPRLDREASVAKRAGKVRPPLECSSGPKKGFGVPIAEWLRGPLRATGAKNISPNPGCSGKAISTPHRSTRNGWSIKAAASTGRICCGTC